jgi:hypothetical protein
MYLAVFEIIIVISVFQGFGKICKIGKSVEAFRNPVSIGFSMLKLLMHLIAVVIFGMVVYQLSYNFLICGKADFLLSRLYSSHARTNLFCVF